MRLALIALYSSYRAVSRTWSFIHECHGSYGSYGSQVRELAALLAEAEAEDPYSAASVGIRRQKRELLDLGARHRLVREEG